MTQAPLIGIGGAAMTLDSEGRARSARAEHALRQLIDKSEALLVAAGAGMGVDSGLPDFRGRTGLWRAYPALRKHGIPFERIANPGAFVETPALAWAFYGHRFHQYRQTTPHSGFARMLAFGHSRPAGYFVMTSNVDGHFQKAGFDEHRVLEVHGSILHLQCLRRCSSAVWMADPESIQVDDDRFEAVRMPHCQQCGALARPNILMFDDSGWVSDRTDMQWARYRRWINDLKEQRKRLLILEVGAGTAIPTIRRMTEDLFRCMPKATLVRINPGDFRVPDGAFSLQCCAKEGIDYLLPALGGA